MCHVPLCHLFDLELWPQGQIKIKKLVYVIDVQAITSLSFNIGRWCLVCVCMTIIQNDGYHYDIHIILTFDLEVIIGKSCQLKIGQLSLLYVCITTRVDGVSRTMSWHSFEIDLDIWPSEVKNLAKLVLTTTFLSFNIIQWYLLYGCITIRRCVMYHHDIIYLTLIFDPKVK